MSVIRRTRWSVLKAVYGSEFVQKIIREKIGRGVRGHPICYLRVLKQLKGVHKMSISSNNIQLWCTSIAKGEKCKSLNFYLKNLSVTIQKTLPPRPP